MGEKGEESGGKGGGNWEWGTPSPPPHYYLPLKLVGSIMFCKKNTLDVKQRPNQFISKICVCFPQQRDLKQRL